MEFNTFFHMLNIINWGNFLTALCGAGFGAISAYFFNMQIEKYRQEQKQKLDFIYLVHFAYYLNDYLLAFKSKTLPPFIETIKNNTVSDFNYPYIQTSFEFDIDLNNYLYLFEKNSHLYYLLRKIQSHLKILNHDIELLNNLSCMGGALHKPLLDKTIEDNDNLINFTDILFNALLNIPYTKFSKLIKIDEFVAYQQDERKIALQSAKENPNLLKGWEGSIITWKK